MPRMTVRARPWISPLRSFSSSAWCAQVTVVPEVSRISVLRKGISHGLKGWIPLGGQTPPTGKRAELDDRRVMPLMHRLADHVAPPDRHDGDHTDKPGRHQPQRAAVHIDHRAAEHESGEARADQRPGARIDEVVGMLGSALAGAHDCSLAKERWRGGQFTDEDFAGSAEDRTLSSVLARNMV